MGDTLAIHGGEPVRTRPFGPGHDFGEDDVAAVGEVIRSGNIGRGPVVEQFEAAFAERHGVEWTITVNSGTSAMHTCIGAVNPDPGDEIIVTPWTSGGSIIGALLHNCVPVFADIDETYTLDPADVEAKITPRTRAIIAVHLFGNACNMAALREIADRHGIFLIEDCCQAHLAEHQGQIVGSIGDIAGISFGGKTLSAGMGGAVLTSNRALWERAVLFRDAALPRDKTPLEGMPYANYFLAPNYKINDIIAALLLNQLGQARRLRRQQGPQRPQHHRGPVGRRRDCAPEGEAGRPPHVLEPGVHDRHGRTGLHGQRLCRRGERRGRADGRSVRGLGGRGPAVPQPVPGRARACTARRASRSTMAGSAPSITARSSVPRARPS